MDAWKTAGQIERRDMGKKTAKRFARQIRSRLKAALLNSQITE